MSTIEEQYTLHIAPDERDPRIQAALTELRTLILQTYPAATFETVRGDDPTGIYLIPTVDVEDLDEVASDFTDRLVDMQVEEALPIYVVPELPAERAAVLRRQNVPLSEETLKALME